MERTLVLLKPDVAERNLVGQILAIYEQQGLSIERLRMLVPSRQWAEAHYEEHRGQPYFEPLIGYLTRGKVVAAVITGEQAIDRVRRLNGPTDPAKAPPESVRGRFALSTRENSVHASDSLASAAREMHLWFGQMETGVVQESRS
jgi:nucleoside-diphosphate kinase